MTALSSTQKDAVGLQTLDNSRSVFSWTALLQRIRHAIDSVRGPFHSSFPRNFSQVNPDPFTDAGKYRRKGPTSSWKSAPFGNSFRRLSQLEAEACAQLRDASCDASGSHLAEKPAIHVTRRIVELRMVKCVEQVDTKL